jgi:methionine sulfoxide reductase heme-binding subunit
VTGDPTFWILARSTGIVSYGLLSCTVLAGLTAKSRPVRSMSPAVTVDLHRFLSLISLMAVALHGIFLALDKSVPIPIVALLVPGTSPYRPLWVALGVLGAELMLLIHLSFRLRKQIGVRTWRKLHYATYLVFGGATAHGLMAGTDSSRRRPAAPAAIPPLGVAPTQAELARTTDLAPAAAGPFTARAVFAIRPGPRYRSPEQITPSPTGAEWPARIPNWSNQRGDRSGPQRPEP